MAEVNSDKRSAYIFVPLIIIAIIFYRIHLNNSWRVIEKTGIEVHAVITSVSFSRGYNVDVEYQCNTKKYTNNFGISGFEPHAGDSLAIKILPENPGGDLVFKEKFYSIPVVYKSHFDWLHKVNKNL